jgi:hypothetical protein
MNSDPRTESALERFISGSAEEAFARIGYLSRKPHAVGLVTAAAGCGKTWLLAQTALTHRAAGRRVVSMDAAGGDGLSVLDSLAGGLGGVGGPAAASPLADFPRPRTTDGVWRRITARLTELRYLGRPITLLIDNVHAADDDARAWIARTTNLPASRCPDLFILLTSTPRGIPTLGGRLLNAVHLKLDLAAWDAVETQQFVTASGYFDADPAQTPAPQFSPDALTELHRLTAGVPRRVQRILEFAVLAAEAAGEATVEPSVVRLVHDELEIAADDE